MDFEKDLIAGSNNSFKMQLEDLKLEDSNKKSMWNFKEKRISWNSSAKKLFWHSRFRKNAKSSLFPDVSKENKISHVQPIPPSPRSPLDCRSFQSQLAYSTESSYLDEKDGALIEKPQPPEVHLENFIDPPPIENEVPLWKPNIGDGNPTNLNSPFFISNQHCDMDEISFFDTSTMNSFHDGFMDHDESYPPYNDAYDENSFSYFPLEMQRSFNDQYKLINILGQGSYGIVYTCTPLDSDEVFASKFISKSNLIEKTSSFLHKSSIESQCAAEFCQRAVYLEVSAMQKLNHHPNIVLLLDVFEDSNFIQLLLEYCNGGDLSEEVSRKGHLSESESVQVFEGLMRALLHCHSSGVVHLDVKMENILLNKTFTRKKRGKYIRFQSKLADFGKAAMICEGETVQGAVGSVVYMAPEVLNGKKYNSSADIWSAGICLYAMLSGRFPWEDASRFRRPEFYGLEWKRISLEAKVLIRKMLSFNPDCRPTAEEVLKHSWLKKRSTIDFDREGCWNLN